MQGGIECGRARAWMQEALDGGRLPPIRRKGLEAHLGACPGCRREWRSLGAAERALRAPRPAPIPASLHAEFLARLSREHASGPDRRLSFWGWLAPFGSMAAGAAAFLVLSLEGPVLPPSGRPVPLEQPVLVESLAARIGARESIPSLGGTRPKVPLRGPTETAGQIRGQREAAALAKAGRAWERAERGRELRSTPGPAALQPAGWQVSEPGTPPVGEGGFDSGPVNIPALRAVHAVEDQPAPPEGEVSPAVLEALRRSVAADVPGMPVQAVAVQLAEMADVPIEVDPAAPQVRVTLAAGNAPCWRLLQEVARQSGLRIYSRGDGLVLQADAVPAEPAGPAANGPDAGIAPEVGPPGPDRRVWPASWGALPESGFAVPRPAPAASR